MANTFAEYTNAFLTALNSTAATDAKGNKITVDDAIACVHSAMLKLIGTPNKVMDFAKNGGVRSVTFNDASSLTCLGNDLGYDQVFAKQVEMQGLPGDLLIAISSSGQSANILAAAERAKAMGCECITLSGFTPGNRLRGMGVTNFYVESGVYGFVETAHQAILHAILDTAMGWTSDTASIQPMGRLQ
jgi:D-sedoheptulose 7-phosphate isomerase